MMRTVDRCLVRAPIDRVFTVAADVERWPDLLSHYRWVTMRERVPNAGVVEMAAWRPFGILRYPTWWVSRMEIDRPTWQVRYQHIEGVTRGMNVVWQLVPRNGHTEVSIVHEWTGPQWPLIGALAARLVIGPIFIHGIAARTLAGIARHVERNHG